MAPPLHFTIRESEADLRRLMRSASPMMTKRLHALLIFKRHEATGISKRQVADQTGASPGSVQQWRWAYRQGGLKGLMAPVKPKPHPSVFTAEQQSGLAARLGDPRNGLVGFVELQAWLEATYGTRVNYKTLHGFVVKRFGAKIKTARKTHVKKDDEAVEAFKKTSTKAAKRSSRPKATTFKR